MLAVRVDQRARLGWVERLEERVATPSSVARAASVLSPLMSTTGMLASAVSRNC
jgi:hypothetical protein